MEDNTSALLFILEEVLGKSKRTNRNNYAFKCPNNCHLFKNKLEINLDTFQYSCWVCGSRNEGYKGSNLSKLLKRLGASPNKISEIKLLTGNKTKNVTYKDTEVALPKEFIKLSEIEDIIDPYHKVLSKHAINYLKKRNIGSEEILKYNIGFCPDGNYGKRIIIPSYDSYGLLNYFTARTFDENEFQKYKNPPVSAKNAICFELYINWNLPIIIVEGTFDALCVKRNIIPLNGKLIHEKLLLKIIESNTKKIYIALDKDAIKDSIRCCETLLSYNKEVYLVEMNDKDFSQMGALSALELLENTDELDYQKLIEIKLNLL